jgi:hypothetical protein
MKRVIRIGVMALLALLVTESPTNAGFCAFGYCWYSPYTQTQTLVGSVPYLWKSFTPSYSMSGPAYQNFVFRSTGWNGSYLGAGRRSYTW